MVFLVVTGLPFKVLVGSDTLQPHSAKTDLGKGTVTLYQEDCVWTGEIKGSKCATHVPYSFALIKEGENNTLAPPGMKLTEEGIWQQKLEEIYIFNNNNSGQAVTPEEKDKLVGVYNKYREVFLDRPGKARDFVCKLKFKNPVKFNRKSYSIRSH